MLFLGPPHPPLWQDQSLSWFPANKKRHMNCLHKNIRYPCEKFYKSFARQDELQRHIQQTLKKRFISKIFKTKNLSQKYKTLPVSLCFPKIVAKSTVSKVQKSLAPKNKSQLARILHQLQLFYMTAGCIGHVFLNAWYSIWTRKHLVSELEIDA